jgi:hypothetical protein
MNLARQVVRRWAPPAAFSGALSHHLASIAVSRCAQRSRVCGARVSFPRAPHFWRLTTYLPLRSFSTMTTDISDAHADISVAESIFRDYGGVTSFHGPISTIKCFENNPLVRSTLETAGNGTIRRKPASFILRERDRGVGYAGRVLVVDGGGSLRCALLGGNLAEHRSSCTPVRRVGRFAPTFSALFSHPTSL